MRPLDEATAAQRLRVRQRIRTEPEAARILEGLGVRRV